MLLYLTAHLQRVFSVRHLMPGQQVANARVQRATATRMRRASEVRHHIETVAQYFDRSCSVQAPSPSLYRQLVDGLALSPRHLTSRRLKFNVQILRSTLQNNLRVAHLGQTLSFALREIPSAKPASCVFEHALFSCCGIGCVGESNGQVQNQREETGNAWRGTPCHVLSYQTLPQPP